MSSDQTVSNILNDLSSVRENLLSLSDDIWDSIDHNNTNKMEEGVQFKREFNSLFDQFEQTTQSLSTLIRQFTGVKETDPEKQIKKTNSPENERLIKSLNKEEPHYLDEDFTFKRPFAFVLNGQAFSGTETWKDLYIQVCVCLVKQNPETFDKILNMKTFLSARGRKYFSRDIKELRVGSKVTNKIFAECNLSAKDIAKELRALLRLYDIDEKNMIIYLREDRNS
jgi:hypothetical protein